MDLLQVQEELNIIIQLMDQQMELVRAVQDVLKHGNNLPCARPAPLHPNTHRINSIPHPSTATYRQFSFSHLSDPAAQLHENLQREYADLVDLRENSNALINRTIQLVNIRLEDHGKAILVFTIVTIIFLPLSFVSSFFGMNFSDIRNMESTQRLFWAVSGSLTVATVGFAIFLAFFGSKIVDKFVKWREARDHRSRPPEPAPRLTQQRLGFRNFEVLDAIGPRRNGPL
jgi:Mg2+ and Co2+ transporter CorA